MSAPRVRVLPMIGRHPLSDVFAKSKVVTFSDSIYSCVTNLCIIITFVKTSHVVQDKESGMPVLLMELMDEIITHFLE